MSRILYRCGSPQTESLKDTQARCWTLWREQIAPAVLANKSILVVAHGNVLRALLKRLDSIDTDVLREISIPRAIPLVYELDEHLVPVAAPGCEGPLSGRYLGNAVTIAKALLSETSSAQLLGNTDHVHVDIEFGPPPDDVSAAPATANAA
jgi:bisphosphoglycerate-dependent phosphoglycerate mutase family 1